jgi:hypothetical protein
VLEEEPQMSASSDCYYGMPKDMLDVASGSANGEALRAAAAAANSVGTDAAAAMLAGSGLNGVPVEGAGMGAIDLSSAEGIEAFAQMMQSGALDAEDEGA